MALIRALYHSWLFQHTPQAILADNIVGLLMIIAPLFWFTVMGTLGVAAGQGMDRLFSGFTGAVASDASAGARVLSATVGWVTKIIK